jgi:D-glycero-alpha-D-manno-heptose-7-phosphate kinase
MIITATPLRISFVGGGTDFEDFYKQHPGMVVSTAINKYVYVIVNERFEKNIRVSYSKTEIADNVNLIEHAVIREAMKLTGVDNGIEIVTIADVPGKGTGLGSSSSLAVGLLNALYALKGKKKSPEELFNDAYKLEKEILGQSCGKQDQYIAAHGGLRQIVFYPDERVETEEIILDDNVKNELDSNLLLFYTGMTRKSSDIQDEQQRNTKNNLESLMKIHDLAKMLKVELNNQRIEKIGEFLHKNWLEKKKLAPQISDSWLDTIYQRALENGASGGKICGAGGGGFFLFHCLPANKNKLKDALQDLQELEFKFEPKGSEIIFNHESN